MSYGFGKFQEFKNLHDRKITFRRRFIKYDSCILDNPRALKLNVRIIMVER
jgi:hypothetical protein